MQEVVIHGHHVPAVGQGTWKMGADPSRHTAEVDALRHGIEQGLTLIDTAEMYADGGAERVVGEAIRDVRDQVFVVSKVWPTHMGASDLLGALEQSLKRLKIDAVDLYLLHWPSRHHPLAESLGALKKAQDRGLARHVGVSNFPTPQLKQAESVVPDLTIAADQVEYHLENRRAEVALIPYAAERQIAVMAYSPVKNLRSLSANDGRFQVLDTLAKKYDCTPETIALAFLIHHGSVIAIPKAVQKSHIDANRQALELVLTSEDLAAIDRAFPPASEELEYQAL
ncbi:aldo/keto reductase [Sulfobacillus harzensis]|uniref:Aldo/keto reductase n=1 Tax=Sulfobacillus harzensis TaxID=2729629 RepID=A0A7Y0L5C3_9FIRM|nr:aldo/keto reductase [Sulfobacillus harzensis]NMP23609.1 aldo/keto reductase [Sulfobacillus harzensis]